MMGLRKLTYTDETGVLCLPAWPVFDNGELEAVRRVIESRNWWRMTGSEVSSFEAEFAAYQNVRFAIGVTNGTHAIELALRCLDLGADDEVIVPSFTFMSTGCAVAAVGAKVVFADVDDETYCLDAGSLESAISSRTKAIIPVHMAGHSCDMDKILALARAKDIHVLEDCAHAHGAEYRGRRLGSLGYAGIFSFQNGKLMTAGEGGALVTCRDDVAKRTLVLHNCGRKFDDEDYLHELCGTNNRLSELQAAVLRVQLSRLDRQMEVRENNAKLLDGLLSEIPGIKPQARREYVTRHGHYMYMFRYSTRAFSDLSRRDFIDYLRRAGIPAFRGFRPLHLMPAFEGLAKGISLRRTDLKVSELIGESAVWIHHRALLGTEEDMCAIAQVIKKLQG